MTIKNGTLTKKGVTIILKNNTDKDYTYGQDFYLEKYEDGKWIEPSTVTGKPLAWNSIGYILKAYDNLELKINFKNTYGNLPKGKYKITKRITKNEDTPVTKDGIIKVSLEFDIK